MKNWTQQFEAMTQAWGDSQRNMWEGWYKMMLAASSGGMNPTGLQGAMDKFKTSQESTMRLVGLTAEAWQLIFEQMRNGQAWQETLNSYVAQVRKQMTTPPNELFAASQDLSKLWQLYVQQWQMFVQPWGGVLRHTPNSLGQGGAAAVEWSQMFWDTYENTFGRLIESPGVGLPREFSKKLRAGFVAWQKMQQATLEYQTMMADTLGKAFDQFMQKLAQKAQKGEPVHTVRELVNLWTDTADEVFVAVFETPQYLEAQWNLLNSNTAHRLQQREIVESLLQMNDLPTLSQIDEANRMLYQHRKEIKALKKAVANGSAPAAAPAPTAPMVPVAELEVLRQEINTLKQQLSSNGHGDSNGVAESVVEELRATVVALQHEVEALKQKAAPKRKKEAVDGGEA